MPNLFIFITVVLCKQYDDCSDPEMKWTNMSGSVIVQKCIAGDGIDDCVVMTALCPAINENNVSEIMSYVNNQAELLKMPASNYGSAVCAKLLLNCMCSNNSNTDLLSINQRYFTDNVIKVCEKFQNDKSSSKDFIDVICSVRVLPVELVWRLHVAGLLDIITYLSSAPQLDRSKCLVQSLSQILHASIKDVPIIDLIIRDICSALIVNSLSPLSQVNSPIFNDAKQMSGDILNKLMAKVLDNIFSSDRPSVSIPILYEVIRKGGIVDKIVLQKFFIQQLSFVLSYCPVYKVSHAISKQDHWSFLKAPVLLVNIFIELLVPLSAKDVVSLLKQIFETSEVNWRMLLTFVSVFIVVCTDAVIEVTALIKSCLNHAFESAENEAMITSFLLARQVANEGRNIFPSYIDWFQGCFGSTSSLANNKKNFIFLMTFLSDLVPHEPASYLRLHIAKAPHIPPKCRSVYSDYKNLAKARLLDLEGDVYESQRESEENKAKSDVEDALLQFEKFGKIPANVLEMCMFRKPYFVARFLTVLLKCRRLPNIPDSKMKFIELLYNTGKIPPNAYSEYHRACEQETTTLSEIDLYETATVASTEHFKRVLQKVTVDLISALEMNNIKGISASLNKITATLQMILKGEQKCSNDLAGEIIVNTACKINLKLIKVIDLILTTFCKIHIALLHCAPTVLIRFASQYVEMITSFPVLFKPLAIRLWDLLIGKAMSRVTTRSYCWTAQMHLKLEPGHISGLGHFLFHLHSSVQTFPTITIKTQHHCTQQRQEIKGPFVQCVSDQLLVSGENEFKFSLRLITAYLCAVAVKEHIYNIAVPSSLLKKFLLLCSRLSPELQGGNSNCDVQFADVKLLLQSARIKNLCSLYSY